MSVFDISDLGSSFVEVARRGRDSVTWGFVGRSREVERFKRLFAEGHIITAQKRCPYTGDMLLLAKRSSRK
jgi:predicted hotdog family 3-hydroxylacyl-ACP dehydratase